MLETQTGQQHFYLSILSTWRAVIISMRYSTVSFSGSFFVLTTTYAWNFIHLSAAIWLRYMILHAWCSILSSVSSRMLNSFFCLNAHDQLFLLSRRACSALSSVSARMIKSFSCLSAHAQLFLLSQRACWNLSSLSARMINSFVCLNAHAQLFLLSQSACSTLSSVSARMLNSFFCLSAQVTWNTVLYCI